MRRFNKYLCFLFCAFATINARAQSNKIRTTNKQTQPSQILTDPVLAAFPGNMQAYLKANFHMTDSMKNEGIQGRIIVQYRVREDGGVDSVKIIRGLSRLLDAEAVRVVGTMPRFKPAYQEGKAVASYYMVPIMVLPD